MARRPTTRGWRRQRDWDGRAGVDVSPSIYAMRKNMWNCLGQWARSQDAEDYDLTVNVGLDGRYCVRARANATYA